MMRALTLRYLALALCCALAPSYAQPASELQVVATDPAPDALMARNEPFFVRFEVKSAVRVTVTASGWFKGRPVLESSGTSAPARLEGNGSGVVSLFYWSEAPTKIDEVHLQISDPSGGAPLAEYAFPVALTWLADEPRPRERARWVKDWQNASQPHGASVPNSAWPDDLWMSLAAAAVIVAVIGGILLDRRRAKSGAGDAGKDG